MIEFLTDMAWCIPIILAAKLFYSGITEDISEAVADKITKNP